MKLALSTVRTNTPFATPPRVRVVADVGYMEQAISLAQAFENLGAEAEVRFAENAHVNQVSFSQSDPDAVVIAGKLGYLVARHHPILEHVLPGFAAQSGK